MEKSTTVDVLNYREDNYSNKLRNSTLQLNISTLVPTLSPFLADIEYNEFVRRCSDFAIIIILLSIGTVGNVHTMLIYWRVTDMQERFHIRTLIIWLSAVDFTTCAVVMPFEAIAIRFSYSISSDVACKLFRSIAHTTIVSSWLILTLIGHERYKSIYGILVATKSEVHCTTCKITNWLKGKLLFQHNLVCFLIILCASVLSTPALFLIGIETVSLKNASLVGTECTTHKEYRGILTAGLYGMAIGVFGISCFIYCSYCYGKILYLIYKQFKKEKTNRRNTIYLTAKFTSPNQPLTTEKGNRTIR
ncbi:unnamed protein product [Mytilus edulis]|uniref:G-protein coupled receptors family 1 profile domain-containing protein n=1 Tax=Mytilus edulis TaxID=6550 RepID=A0A8S3UKX1_MYTED|nr:unnamed protein product [Mytilus edulis]